MDVEKALEKAASEQNEDIEGIKNIAKSIKKQYSTTADGFIKELENVGESYVAPDYLMEKAELMNSPLLQKFVKNYKEIVDQEKDN